jgi:UTP--glucose-1-phosphate uridylyltransferase
VAITTAVVPVAGLATRLRPLSLGVPKALLPVAGRPVVRHIVAELAACGIERVVLVTGGGREGFEAQFADTAGPEIVFAEQPRPLGLGDAILRATPHLDGPFAIALGDALLGRGTEPARVLDRLAAAVEGGASAAVAVEEVAPADTARYGIVVPAGGADAPAVPPARAIAAPSGDAQTAPFPIAGVVEKPSPEAAPSRLAIAGRYAATPALLDALRDAAPNADGEIQLADALAALDDVVGVRLEPGEERLDVGNVPGYCAAFVEYALSDPELGPALRARARALLDGQR